MVLFTLVEFAVETGIWTVKTTYNVGYWMLYGTPKTPTEKLLEKLCEENTQLHNDLVVITRRLEQLEGERAQEHLSAIDRADAPEVVKDVMRDMIDDVEYHAKIDAEFMSGATPSS